MFQKFRLDRSSSICIQKWNVYSLLMVVWKPANKHYVTIFSVNAFFLRIPLYPSTKLYTHRTYPNCEYSIGILQWAKYTELLNISRTNALENWVYTESTARTEALPKWRVMLNLVLIVCEHTHRTEWTIQRFKARWTVAVVLQTLPVSNVHLCCFE